MFTDELSYLCCEYFWLQGGVHKIWAVAYKPLNVTLLCKMHARVVSVMWKNLLMRVSEKLCRMIVYAVVCRVCCLLETSSFSNALFWVKFRLSSPSVNHMSKFCLVRLNSRYPSASDRDVKGYDVPASLVCVNWRKKAMQRFKRRKCKKWH